MLILSPPKRADDENGGKRMKTALDINFLDKDLLKFDALDVNFLNVPDKLSVNQLDQQFLYNMLDLLNASLLANMLGGENQMLPNYAPNKAAGLQYYLADTNLTLYRTGLNGYAEVTVDKDTPATLVLNQDGANMTQNVQRSGGSTITIRQSQ